MSDYKKGNYKKSSKCINEGNNKDNQDYILKNTPSNPPTSCNKYQSTSLAKSGIYPNQSKESAKFNSSGNSAEATGYPETNTSTPHADKTH